VSDERRGFALAIGAYVMWGVLPVYWAWLEPAGATEILAHRIFWSVVITGAMLVIARRTGALAAIWRRPKARLGLTIAGIVIAFNWGAYIWGVNNGHVVDTSLGYYINPLVTVLMGVIFLQEKLRPAQWGALAIAAGAVVVLSVGVGHPPWISLILAFSFGTYGLVKKRTGVGPVEGLTWEGLVLVPFALGYIVWLSVVGQATAFGEGGGHLALLAFTGVITAAPLLCFSGAANRISLTTLGLLQYLAPTIQLVIGIMWFEEPMGTQRWIGFSLVWLALVVFTFESIAHRRRTLKAELALEQPALSTTG
jgi:chloramphenicol-sensitive protein RarD